MKEKSIVKSLIKGISILKCFSYENYELTASEISLKIGLPMSTLHRILQTLVATNFLELDTNTKKYLIGHTMYFIGSLHIHAKDLLVSAEPVITTINEITNEAVNIGILLGTEVVLLMRREASHPFRIILPLGWTSPSHASAMGKALLSELTEEEIDLLFPEENLKKATDKTIATKSELKLALKRIKDAGIAFDREGSYEGVEGIGAVIRDKTGDAVAALSVPVPIFRMNESYRERIAELVKMASELVSYMLGYRPEHQNNYSLEEIRNWWNQHK